MRAQLKRTTAWRWGAAICGAVLALSVAGREASPTNALSIQVRAAEPPSDPTAIEVIVEITNTTNQAVEFFSGPGEYPFWVEVRDRHDQSVHFLHLPVAKVRWVRATAVKDQPMRFGPHERKTYAVRLKTLTGPDGVARPVPAGIYRVSVVLPVKVYRPQGPDGSFWQLISSESLRSRSVELEVPRPTAK